MSSDGLKKISEGALIILVGTILAKLLGYAYRFIIARTGSETYGMISIGLATLGVLSVISTLGLDLAVTRYISYYQEKNQTERAVATLKSALKITTITSIFIGILLFLFSDQLANILFHKAEVAIILKIFAFAIPLSTIRNIFLAATRGLKKIQYEIYSKSLSENILRIAFTIIVIIMGYRLFGISVAYVLAILISLVISFYFSEKNIPILKTNKTASMKKELLTYAIPLTIASIFLLIMVWTDTIMIGFFRTMSEVGIYNAVMPLSQLMHIFTTAFIALFLPIITELFAKNNLEEINQIYKTILKWVLIINLIILSLFLTFPSQILTILFGPEYSIGATSLMILSVGAFLYSFALISFQILIIFKETKRIMFISIAATLINIILNYLLIPRMGINGASIATSISFLIFSILIFLKSTNLIKRYPISSKFLNVIFCSVVSLSFLILIKGYVNFNNKILNLIVLGVSLIIVYLILLIITKSFGKEDIDTIRNLQQKVRINFNPINNILRRFI
ncbi:MAG: flippase [Candidatus Nanoarchaeia archaeon]|nr:flippase [Candidatus Nanoarchaeia archaeon]